MIDINKKYRTRDGDEVIIDGIKESGIYPVFGRIKDNNEWLEDNWTLYGDYILGDTTCLDLIEVTS